MLCDLCIALVSCQSVTGDTPGNLARIDLWSRAARKKGADLVCFPELSITGYHIHDPVKDSAENIAGPSSGFIEKISKKYNISILAGIAEKSRGRIYISHILFTPQSGIAGVYRKLHLAPPEKKIFTPGANIPHLFETHGICLGIQLCYDAHFPELSSAMALKGADIILIPHASPGKCSEEKIKSWMRHLTARAFDNGIYVAAVNAAKDNGWGLFFPPAALVISPEGKITSSYTEADEGMIVAKLSADLLQKVRSHPMKYFLPNRRKDLY
jgi:N-carbamoylputrescine amidase